MDFTFPEKYHEASRYFDFWIGGDLESTDKLDNEKKLMFYALRMQAERGPCREPAPSLWHVTERYKHQAWSKLSSMTSFEAMVFFVKHFEDVLREGNPQMRIVWMEKVKEIPSASSAPTAPTAASSPLVPECEWDEDLLAHRAPTTENIAYLASLVMRSRRAAAPALPSQAPPSLTQEPSAPSPLSSSSSFVSPVQPRDEGKPVASLPRRLRPIYGPAIVHARGRHGPLLPPMRPELAEVIAEGGMDLVPPQRPLATTPDTVNPPIRSLVDEERKTDALQHSASKEPSDAQAPTQKVAPPEVPQSTGGWASWFGL